MIAVSIVAKLNLKLNNLLFLTMRRPLHWCYLFLQFHLFVGHRNLWHYFICKTSIQENWFTICQMVSWLIFFSFSAFYTETFWMSAILLTVIFRFWKYWLFLFTSTLSVFITAKLLFDGIELEVFSTLTNSPSSCSMKIAIW